jgi:hypothetical protein
MLRDHDGTVIHVAGGPYGVGPAPAAPDAPDKALMNDALEKDGMGSFPNCNVHDTPDKTTKDTCTSMYFEGIELPFVPFALQMSVVWWYFGASI